MVKHQYKVEGKDDNQPLVLATCTFHQYIHLGNSVY